MNYLKCIVLPAVLVERSLAELSFVFLKGIDNLRISPQHADPFIGYVALKSYMPNHRFLGHYGEGNQGFLCGHPKLKIAKLLQERRDCPLDRTAEWIQRLFPSTDGSNFTANQMTSDHVSRFTPKLIGKIIEFLAVNRLGGTYYEATVSKLTDILHEELNLIGFVASKLREIRHTAKRDKKKISGLRQWLKENWEVIPVTILKKELPALCKWALKDEARKIPELEAQLALETPDSLCDAPTTGGRLENFPGWLRKLIDRVTAEPEKLEVLFSPSEREIQRIHKFLKMEEQMDGLPQTQYGDPSQFREIARLIIDAVREARGHVSVSDGYSYTNGLVEEALLAFMIRRIDSKAELADYLENIPLLIGSVEFNREQFISDVWGSSENPKGMIEAIQADSHLREMKNRRETFLHAYKELHLMTSILPPLVHMGSASHKQGKLFVGHPDCGETSLRNFFNMMLYNKESGIYDVDVLGRIEERSEGKIQFDKALKEFYAQHNDPKDTSETLRSEWAWKIVSRRPGITYKSSWLIGQEEGKPPKAASNVNEFEIMSQGKITNMFKLLGQLMYQSEAELSEWNALSPHDQVKRLCDTFSREDDGFTVSGSLSGDNSLQTVSFRLETPSGPGAFVWSFVEGHFSLTVSIGAGVSDYTDWMQSLDMRIGRSSDEELVQVAPVLFARRSEMLTDLVILGENKPELAFKLLMSGDFVSTDARRNLFPHLLEMRDGKLKSVARPLLIRLMKLLESSPDQFSRNTVFTYLRRNGFPFGIPEDLREEVSGYRQLKGSEVAWFSPKSKFAWETKVFDSKVVLPSEYSMDNYDSWQEAAELCISFNKPDERERIRQQFYQREVALEAIRGKHKPDSITPEIEAVYKQFPINGVAMLSTEEWMKLDESEYTSKVVHNLGSYVWSGARIIVSLNRPLQAKFAPAAWKARAMCVYSHSSI
jgi:hypothetical protein